MAPFLATMALIHVSALGLVLLSSRFSVRRVDEHERPLDRHVPEPRPGDLTDPPGHRLGPTRRPEPRWLA
jgi:hypothetical protein